LKQLKPKKCKVCGELYSPRSSLQKVCGVECSKTYARAQGLKKIRQDTKIERERLKNRSDWIKDAQVAFNTYIRARDKANGFGCISCGTRQGKENAGHFRSVGSCPELRFEEKNVYLQCERCNTFFHGNLLEYRKNLIQRVGLETVDWLEGKHEPKKYTIDDLKEIIKTYKAKLKEVKP